MRNIMKTTMRYLIILMGFALVMMRIEALAIWNGVATSSTDENVNITADSLVPGAVNVQALSANIAVNVVGASRTLFGSGQLVFEARNGFSITVNVPENLTFTGAADNVPLLIGFCTDPGSTIEFVLNDGRSVILTGNTVTNTGGAYAFIIMSDTPSAVPAVQFTRQSTPSAGDVSLIIGARSMFSFLATDFLEGATSQGTLRFNTENGGSGRMNLNILDDGAFVVAGHLYEGDCYAGTLQLANIDFKTPAGFQAIVETNNGTANSASLLVTNENTVISPLMIDPFNNGSFAAGDGIRRGFVVGGNGVLRLLDGTYLDYVGETLNVCPPPCGACDNMKYRNGSALIVDGVTPAYCGSSFNALFDLQGSSAIYFRSGVDNEGNVNAPSFLIDPALQTPGFGNIVFDVEGKLIVQGDSATTNALQLLSIEVAPTGGSVTIDSTETTFPLRTFAKDADDKYLQYNKGSFLINNALVLNTLSLVHTDMLHAVYEKNDVKSEATYVGGDSFVLKPNTPRPCIEYINAILRIHTNIAYAGVDQCVPNVDTAEGNSSQFILYYNGYCIDEGIGRYVILGTRIGGLACDNGTIIDQDSHLNVFQTTAQATASVQELFLAVAPNNDTIIENVPAGIDTQLSLHSIYLGHATNISIGTNADVGTDECGTTFALTTTPTVEIVGNYIGFESRGGPESQPESSSFTGRGGLFVDSQGVITLECPIRAFFNLMVVQSHNGIINLPKDQVLFHNRVGIATWQVDLSDPVKRIVVAPGQVYSDYTLDWSGVEKDCTGWVPYEISVCTPCSCPPVTAANITAIPTIQGEVDQFQVLHSQFGNTAHIKVDGGFARELIFLEGTRTGESAIGIVVLENDGRVGLGNANTTIDSLSGAVRLGANGVSIIANGPGIVEVNSDLEITNICHLIAGPAFGLYGEDRLVFRSTVPREILVKSGGALDVSSFMTRDQVLEFDGFVKLVFEPGSRLIMGGGTINFQGNSGIQFQPFIDQDRPAGTTVASTDDIRVKFSGTGTIIIQEEATADINRGAYVGIENLAGCSLTTDITFNLRDTARFTIGDDANYGGSLQVGNTSDIYGGSVSFSLIVSGIDTIFEVNSQGFLGFGVGIVNKPNTAPDTWLVGTLSNVAAINLNFEQGYFNNRQIRTGDNKLASLTAIGPVSTGYSFSLDSINVDFLGGGNLILVPSSVASFAPVVQTTDGVIDANYSAGIISSTRMITDASKPALPLVNVTPAAFFNALKVFPLVDQASGQGPISLNTLGVSTMAYIFNGIITRMTDFIIIGPAGIPVDDTFSLVIGSVGLAIDTTGIITNVGQLNP